MGKVEGVGIIAMLVVCKCFSARKGEKNGKGVRGRNH